MGNSLTAIRDQFARIWGNMGRIQKISVGVIAAVAVVSLGVFMVMSSRPNYVTVFNNLTEQDASAIVNKLKSTKIPYETADGGKTIKVPRDKADDVRLSVAASGLPQSGVVGYEVFDKTNFKATQEQLKLQRDYEQGLQRDLQNTLDRVLGPSQSVVKVTAVMNFDQSQTTSELFAPDNKSVVRSQRQVTENFQGSGTPPIGGVPGTESNVPTYQGAIAAGGPSQYSKTDNTQNYE